RIQNPAHLQGSGLADLSVLGVDLAIDPASECAEEMAALLRTPLAHEVAPLFEGQAVAAVFKIPDDARNLGLPLAQYPNPGVLRDIRIIALTRGGTLAIPGGDTRLEAGDIVAVAGGPAKIQALANDLAPGRMLIRKVVIAGGGAIGLDLARRLERLDQFGIVLLERDPAVAERCAGALRQTLVLCGDMLSQDFMQTAGITGETAFATTLADNEDNLIAALLARKNGARLTLGRVSKLEYLPIIRQVGLLDRVVNPYLSMSNTILHFIRGKHAANISSFQTLPGELHEVVITPKFPFAAVPLREARLPRGLIVAAILRGAEAVMPAGETTLEPGDRAVIFGEPGATHKIAALCK
ncbi:MAG: NAD-binding protein, partial [Kiritimatiellaeota bacterium]|nr:NAD-binding protein [Kiritimatiellota bacterium]